MVEQASQKEFTSLMAICICVNCCVTGSILSIPWAFSEAGWALSLILSVFTLILLLILALYVVQILSRVEKLESLKANGYSVSYIPLLDIFLSKPVSSYIKSQDSSEETPLIQEKTVYYEFTYMCRVLLGPRVEKSLSIMIITLSTFVFFGAVSMFSSSMVSTIPIYPLSTCDIYNDPGFDELCRYKYIFYVVVLAVITSILAFLFDFREQGMFFIIAFMLRMIALLIMEITALIVLANDDYLGDEGDLDVDVARFNIKSFGVVAPIISLTLGFHNLIPYIVHPLKKKEKKLTKVLAISVAIAFSLTLSLGYICLFSISQIEPLVTLNWDEYSNGKDPGDREWWAYVIDTCVSFYPAIDVISIISIFLNYISNNIALVIDNEISSKNENRLRNIKIFVMVVGFSVPMVFYDLGIIYSLAGCFALVIYCFFIPLMARASFILVPEKLSYDNIFTSKYIMNGICVVSVMYLVLVWIGFAVYLADKN